jgi:2,4-dienoyl-CoA reductase-like NADH-dependent reductase (Old Yellow Enzyme family)
MGTGFTLEQTIHFLSARAKSDVAFITTPEVCVHISGKTGLAHELFISHDDHIKPLSTLARAIHDAGSRVIMQINHAGRYSPSIVTGQQSVAPSPIMSGYTGETPRELSTQEADDLVVAFAEAALRARKADFDGIELLGSSGYLISQFMSPLTNKRTDKYGGDDTLKRGTFLFSILREIRNRVGKDFNICVKFDADDGMPGGKTMEDSLRLAPEMIKNGADRLHIWAGWHEATRPMLPMYVPRAAFAYMAAEIKKVVSVPVSTVGRINDPYVAAEILAKKQADLIGLGRPLLCDPDFVKKTMEGRVSEIRRCTACCYCFDTLVQTVRGESVSLKCALNPELGREGENLIKPTVKKKNVAVIGGGPAGMEAARIASIRGHSVTLYEKDNKLGGMLKLACLPPHKEEIKGLIDFYIKEMELRGVNLKSGKEITISELKELKPDVVVIATGARAMIPKIPGIIENEFVTALEVLGGSIPSGKNVLVIGGGLIGVETAEYLNEKDKKVSLVEMFKIASDVGPTLRWGLISRLRKKVTIYPSTKVIEIKDKKVIVNIRDK